MSLTNLISSSAFLGKRSLVSAVTWIAGLGLKGLKRPGGDVRGDCERELSRASFDVSCSSGCEQCESGEGEGGHLTFVAGRSVGTVWARRECAAQLQHHEVQTIAPPTAHSIVIAVTTAWASGKRYSMPRRIEFHPRIGPDIPYIENTLLDAFLESYISSYLRRH